MRPLHGQVAQLVEQRIENPRVGGSIPSLATRNEKQPGRVYAARLLFICRIPAFGIGKREKFAVLPFVIGQRS
jgi:hypothetical protein